MNIYKMRKNNYKILPGAFYKEVEMMDIIEILRKLVGFNTIKDKENSNILGFIENFLISLGFKTKRIKKNLVATIGENPIIGFMGHTDTVPHNKWDGNPFEITIDNNKIIGLGTCDMKGGIAALLSAVSKVCLDNKALVLYFTYDEETDFKGIKALKNETFPNTIIIGEPTNNIPIYGTKGVLEVQVEFNGIKVHSSTPEKGKNAIYECMSFINKLLKYYEKLKNNTVSDFEIPYTTMNIGMISGGESVNSVAGKCEISIDFRIVKKEQINEIIKDLNKLLIKYDSKLIIKKKVEPKINSNDISFIEGISNKKKTANYLTEASFINTKAIILGPGPITAHEANEYITIDSLKKCEEIYIKIIEKYQRKSEEI